MATTAFFLVVSGSRNFSNPSIIAQHLQQALQKQPNLVLISGGAKGADRLVQEWASNNHVPCLVVPAKWHKFGKSAGPIRNNFMLAMGQGLLAFPQASSKGTVSIIRQAKKLGLPTKVVQP
jgi:hypothetical protein